MAPKIFRNVATHKPEHARTKALAMHTPIKTSAKLRAEIDGAVGHDDRTEVTSHDGWSTRESPQHVIYYVTRDCVREACSCLWKYEIWKRRNEKLQKQFMKTWEASSGAVGKLADLAEKQHMWQLAACIE